LRQDKTGRRRERQIDGSELINTGLKQSGKLIEGYRGVGKDGEVGRWGIGRRFGTIEVIW
jgi:hypothetical protein